MSLDVPAVTPAAVLDFWFGRLPTTLEELQRAMLRHGPPLDAEVRGRFGAVVEAALAGAYEDWAEAPRSMLALILLVDQFPRHVFRGTARQHEGDARALALAQRAHARGWGDDFEFIEALYLYMPFAHAEDVAMQRLSLALADRLSARAPEWVGFFRDVGPGQARKYLAVIERFGRFPHRNAPLGRESTPEELEFLKTWFQPPEVLRDRGLI